MRRKIITQIRIQQDEVLGMFFGHHIPIMLTGHPHPPTTGRTEGHGKVLTPMIHRRLVSVRLHTITGIHQLILPTHPTSRTGSQMSEIPPPKHHHEYPIARARAQPSLRKAIQESATEVLYMLLSWQATGRTDSSEMPYAVQCTTDKWSETNHYRSYTLLYIGKVLS